MNLPIINTREDLDAIVGTTEHDAFMALLAGTLWRVEKDDTAQAWVAIEDNSTIERFAFTRADFPVVVPELPKYLPNASTTAVPQLLTNYQGKVTLDAFQLYEEVEAYMQLETTSRAAKLAWNTGAFERQGSLILALADDFGITDEQLDSMFIYGAQVQ